MPETLTIDALRYVHVISLSLWFGGLFGYVVIVWPAIISEANGDFPRALLARIAMRTAPWIYLAMASAVASLVAIWLLDPVPIRAPWMLAYALLLTALVANNVYGTLVAWPRIMLLPGRSAATEWSRFRWRMSVALVLGLTLYSVAVVAR
jgi:uncharacterized membrane protein